MWRMIHTQSGSASMPLPHLTGTLPTSGYISQPTSTTAGPKNKVYVKVTFTDNLGAALNTDAGTFDMYLWQECPNRLRGSVSYGFSDVVLGGTSCKIYQVVDVDDIASRTGTYIYSGISLTNINFPPSATGFYIEARGVV